MSDPQISGFDTKAYTPVLDSPGCKHCKKGAVWTVVGPFDIGISESWEGDEAELTARLRADELNTAYEAGIAVAIAAKRGVAPG
jgi:hypothetical protein